MVIYDFCCEHGHPFEGWFGSWEEWVRQRDDGLLACPVCASPNVTRELPAPAVHVPSRTAATSRPEPAPERADEVPDGSADSAAAPPPAPRRLGLRRTDKTPLRAAVDAVRDVLAREFEDVGPRFAEEAEAMYFGESETRNIAGVSTAEEEAELRELGVPFHKIRLPRFDD